MEKLGILFLKSWGNHVALVGKLVGNLLISKVWEPRKYHLCINNYVMFVVSVTVQFEGSLGRLTASSVHNPRRIIDININSVQDSEDSKTKASRRFKQLLWDLEKVSNY